MSNNAKTILKSAAAAALFLTGLVILNGCANQRDLVKETTERRAAEHGLNAEDAHLARSIRVQELKSSESEKALRARLASLEAAVTQSFEAIKMRLAALENPAPAAIPAHRKRAKPRAKVSEPAPNPCPQLPTIGGTAR